MVKRRLTPDLDRAADAEQQAAKLTKPNDPQPNTPRVQNMLLAQNSQRQTNFITY